MKVLLLAVAAALLLPAIPSADASLGCVGYQACYQATGDGWAIACVFSPLWPAKISHCVDVECESCGNGPIQGFDLRAPVLP